MADIFREIDEEVRRDKALEFWNKNGKWLIAIAVIIVLGTAGWRAYSYYQGRAAEQAGARFEAAIEASRAGETDKAAAEFAAMAKESTAGYEKLARLRVAAETAKQDPAKGVAAYDAIASGAGETAIVRDLARLRAAYLVADTASREELRQRLEPLLVSGNAWGGNARELLGLAALKAGDIEGAGKFFDEIVTDRNAPPSLRQRADLLLGLVRAGPVKPAP